MLRALLFDVDGTLADTERDGHRVAFNLAFREAGLPWEWDVPTYGDLLSVAGGKERIRHFLTSKPELQPLDDQEIAALHAAKTQRYVELVSRGQLPLRRGVARLISEARTAGLHLGIATTTSPENVTALIEATLGPGATDWFSVIAAGDVVPAKKPAPDIYTYALDRLGLPASSALAVEDSENGVLSARGAGLSVVVTVNDYTRDQDFSGALAVLEELENVTLAWLRALHRTILAPRESPRRRP
jgi:HAD superfamily hydrolase (TIGR01509 family)